MDTSQLTHRRRVLSRASAALARCNPFAPPPGQGAASHQQQAHHPTPQHRFVYTDWGPSPGAMGHSAQAERGRDFSPYTTPTFYRTLPSSNAFSRQALNQPRGFYPGQQYAGQMTNSGLLVDDLLADLELEDQMSDSRLSGYITGDAEPGNLQDADKTLAGEHLTGDEHEESRDRVEPMGVFASRMKRLTDWKPFRNWNQRKDMNQSGHFLPKVGSSLLRSNYFNRSSSVFAPHATCIGGKIQPPPDNLTELFKQSSIPGFREISQSRNWFRKLTWLMSSLILGLLALKDISQLLAEYLTYPITVNVRLRDSRRLPFPAITICNLNIVRHSVLCNSTHNFTMPPELEEKLCKTSNLDKTDSQNTKKDHIDINDYVKEEETTTSSTTTELPDINDYGTMGATRPPPKPPDVTTVANKMDIDSFLMISQNSPTTTTSTEDPFMEAMPVNTPPVQFERPLMREKRQINRRRFGSGISSPSLGPSSGSSSGSGPSGSSDSGGTTLSPLLKSLASTTAAPGSSEDLDLIELTEREEKELQENMTNWLAVMYNTRREATLMLGHQFEDIILRCTIKTTNCTHPRSFEQSFTPTEGNCFTYRSKTNFHPRRGGMNKQEEASLAGVNYGLELVLNLEIKEYLPGSAQIGALVMVHHPDDFGNSASEAIFVAPEQATYIGLKMVNITRLEYPYPEDCINFWPPALTGSLTQNATYSQQACLKICLQRTIQKQCACQSAMLPQLEINSTLRICDTRRRMTRTCVENVMFHPEDKVNDCTCPPRCNVITYDKTISVAKWPTREDRVTFDRGKTNVNFQNLAKVVVYFQTMTCQEVTQQAAYTSAKLFSSVGGIMGMYLGFSFLSVFEILEVFVRRLWYAIWRRKPKKFRVAVQAITASLHGPSTTTSTGRLRYRNNAVATANPFRTRSPAHAADFTS